MLMMRVLTLVFLLDALKAAAYAVVDNLDADAKNAECCLPSCWCIVVLLMSPLLLLLRQLMIVMMQC